MPKVDVWPFEALSQNEKNIRFKPVTLTVRELMAAKDGTSQAGNTCLLYTSPSPRDRTRSRMPSSA